MKMVYTGKDYLPCLLDSIFKNDPKLKTKICDKIRSYEAM